MELLNKIKEEVLSQKTFNEDVKNDPREVRLALKNAFVIDPYNIKEYIARDGYQALYKALKELTREALIEEVKASGLRGRSGGGFPTGLKWSFTTTADIQKYVVCNADEGIPGDYMDRICMEHDPHMVLEGLMISAIANGADKGFFYIRKEYPEAHRTIAHAVKEARELGILGSNVFGTDFSFDVEIVSGAGAYICGEETALIESIEGSRGASRNKPPYPSVEGLFNKPTIVNNVETLACVPSIVLNGAESFNQYGSEKSKGTNIFTVSGRVKKPGFYELPLGITLRELIFDICGGPLEGHTITAIMPGGPAGGLVPEKLWDEPTCFDIFNGFNIMLGAGGIVVIDETIDILETIEMFLEFGIEESCGKCTPCRAGTVRQIELLKLIMSGKASMSDLEELEKLSRMILRSSLCGLGMSTSFPLLSALAHYRDEFTNLIKDGEHHD